MTVVGFLFCAGSISIWAQAKDVCTVTIWNNEGRVGYDGEEIVYGYGTVYANGYKITGQEQTIYVERGGTLTLKATPDEGHIISEVTIFETVGPDKRRVEGLDTDFRQGESKQYVMTDLQHDLQVRVSFIDYRYYSVATDVDGISYQAFQASHTADVSGLAEGRAESDEPVSIPEEIIYNGEHYTVTAIGGCAFYRTTLPGIVIPPTVERIKMYAFDRCKMPELTIPESVTRIDKEAFCYCDIERVIFPEHMGSLTLGESLFISYESTPRTGVKYVRLPVDMEEIPKQMFYGTQLESLQIPSTVRVIGRQAFEYTALVELEIPEGVAEIPYQALFGCKQMRKLTLPSTVTSVESQAFGDNTMDTLVCRAATPPEGLSAFSTPGGMAKRFPVMVVPNGSKEAYQSIPDWSLCTIVEESEATGVDRVRTEEGSEDRYYTTQGRQISAPQKGLNLIRKKNGETRKVFIWSTQE